MLLISDICIQRITKRLLFEYFHSTLTALEKKYLFKDSAG